MQSDYISLACADLKNSILKGNIYVEDLYVEVQLVSYISETYTLSPTSAPSIEEIEPIS